MSTIKFEVTTTEVANNVYVTNSAIKAHVPQHLRSRLQQENVPAEYMVADVRDHGKVEFNPSEHVLTGNDTVYIRTQDGAVRCTFRPIVDIKSSMGEGYLVEVASGEMVNDSPMVDYDYQDCHFDDNLALMLRFMRSINA